MKTLDRRFQKLKSPTPQLLTLSLMPELTYFLKKSGIQELQESNTSSSSPATLQPGHPAQMDKSFLEMNHAANDWTNFKTEVRNQ